MTTKRTKEKVVKALDIAETAVTLGFPVIYYGGAVLNLYNFDPREARIPFLDFDGTDFERFRPDHKMHAVWMWGFNKVGRRLAMRFYDSGRLEQSLIGKAVVGVIGGAKELFDLAVKGYDPTWQGDFYSGLAGAFAEDVKALVVEPRHKKKLKD